MLHRGRCSPLKGHHPTVAVDGPSQQDGGRFHPNVPLGHFAHFSQRLFPGCPSLCGRIIAADGLVRLACLRADIACLAQLLSQVLQFRLKGLFPGRYFIDGQPLALGFQLFNGLAVTVLLKLFYDLLPFLPKRPLIVGPLDRGLQLVVVIDACGLPKVPDGSSSINRSRC